MTNSALAAKDARLHALALRSGVADTGTYTDDTQVIPCRVFVDRDAQVVGEFAPTAGALVTVRMLRADVPDPAAGARLTIGGEVFQLDALQSQNETTSVWIVMPLDTFA